MICCASPLQIAITAVLGCDSYLVMRHGAGPRTCGGTNEVPAQIESSSTEDALNHQRLGCCFCNDAAFLFNVHQCEHALLLFLFVIFPGCIIGASCQCFFSFYSQFLMEHYLGLPRLYLVKQWSSLLGCYIILTSKMSLR